MAVVIAPNIIEIAAVHTYAGRQSVNVWHMFRSPETGEPSASQSDIAQDFANNWQDHMLNFVDDTVQIAEFRWRGLSSVESPSGTIIPDLTKPITGGQSGQGLPPNVAVLVHKLTDRPRGRRDGRSFHVGATEAMTDEPGTLTQALIDFANAKLQAFLDGVSDTGTGVVDRYPVVLEVPPAGRLPGPGIVEATSRRITALRLDALVATQRRRLR